MNNIVDLEIVKSFLRVDYPDEDTTINILIETAQSICRTVARITVKDWDVILEHNQDSYTINGKIYTVEELENIKGIMKVAVLYAISYLFEHRENTKTEELDLTLKSLLSSIREGKI